MSRGQGAGPHGGMYSEDQCIMGNDDIGTFPPSVNRQTRVKTLPFRNFVGGNEESNASSWINTTEGISILFGSHVVNFIPSTGYPCLS